MVTITTIVIFIFYFCCYQDQLYLFLKDVLFKPKNVFPKLKESPSPRKKKKKLTNSICGGISVVGGACTDKTKEEGGSKKKKKLKQFQLLTTSNDGSSSYVMSPLDVSIGINESNSNMSQTSQGLLTTGSTIFINQRYCLFYLFFWFDEMVCIQCLYPLFQAKYFFFIF